MPRGGKRPGSGRRPVVPDSSPRTIRASREAWNVLENEVRIWNVTPSQVVDALLRSGALNSHAYLFLIADPNSPISGKK